MWLQSCFDLPVSQLMERSYTCQPIRQCCLSIVNHTEMLQKQGFPITEARPACFSTRSDIALFLSSAILLLVHVSNFGSSAGDVSTHCWNSFERHTCQPAQRM